MSFNPDDPQQEEILRSIPKFHLDHAPEDSLLLKLTQIYQETVRYAETLYDEAHASMTPGTTPILHTVPYFRIPVDAAWYTPEIANMIGQMPFEDQIEWLSREGKFIPIAFGSEQETTLYALTLKKSFHAPDERKLELLEDYFVRENRIYLLPRLIQETTQQLTHLHAFDLKLNRRTIEKVWPSPYEKDVEAFLPRYQFRDAVEAFHVLMQSELTIRDMDRAIRKATGWDTFKVEDRLSRGLSIGKKRMYDEMDISPATFIVAIPEMLAGDKVRINVALTLVDEAKESQTHYWFVLEVDRVDVLIPETTKRVVTQKRKLDTTQKEDEAKHFIYRRFLDDLFDGMQYDLAIRYDQSGLFGGFYDGTFSWDAKKFTAVMEVIRHHFDLPLCPENFPAIGKQLDVMTDRLNIRSYKQDHEEPLFYEQRRLKEVLLALGEAGLHALFSGLRPFQFSETLKMLGFGRDEVLTQEDAPIVKPVLRHVDNLFFRFEEDKLDLNVRLDPDEGRPAPVGFQLDVDSLPEAPVAEAPAVTEDVLLDVFRFTEERPTVEGLELDTDTLSDEAPPSEFYLDSSVLDDEEFEGFSEGEVFDADAIRPTRDTAADSVQVIRRAFPEIPRAFLREPYYTKTRFVVRPNQDGTERFELLGSADGMDWAVIESQPNETSATKVAFSHDVNASSTRYYRVRAVAGIEYSLPTLALDATVMPIL